MSMRYCMKCMNRQFPGVAVCPNCGTPYNQPVQKPNALRPGQILNGKYLVGAVLSEQANIPGSRERLRKYWFIPMIVYCVYLIVYCAESLDFPFFIMESIAGCALTLAMRGFALQNNTGK